MFTRTVAGTADSGAARDSGGNRLVTTSMTTTMPALMPRNAVGVLARFVAPGVDHALESRTDPADDDELDVAGFRRARESRYGIDLKAVVHDNVTLDLAFRPDFSQVEPDAPQVTVNERFEKRVDEKRPFFIENAGYFQTPLELFFPRRIQDPERGARVTSKLGPWAVGALLMDDREPGRVEVDDPFYGKRAYTGVVRVQREFSDQSTIGFFASDRELAGDFHRAYAADMRLKVGTNWVATGHLAQTQSREPETSVSPFSGVGSYFKVQREGRGFDLSAKYLSLSPGFAAPLGFIPRVGIKQGEAEIEYTFRPRKSLVKAWGPKANAVVVYDWNRQVQDAELELSGVIELPADTKLEVGWQGAFERFEGLEFRRYMNKVDLESEWLKWLALSVSYERGTEVNHDPPKRVLPFLALAQATDLTVTLRTSRMEFKQSLTYDWLRSPRIDPIEGTIIRPIYNNWVLESKLKLQLSRELSVRAIANYEALIPNELLSGEDEERELLPDVLITYLVNPWTAVHAGYTERFENVLLDRGEVVDEPRNYHYFKKPATSVDRQYFLKLSYLFRM